MDAFFTQATQLFATLDIVAVWGICLGVLLLCGMGLPIPEDITLVVMGYMTWLLVPAHGQPGPALHVAGAVAVGLVGVLAGDALMFTLGQRLGIRLILRWPFRSILGHGRDQRAREFLASHGPKVLFSARFMPGLRSVVFFTSGTLGIRLRTFLFYDGLAAIVSVPALVLSAWYWGEEIQTVIDQARKAENGILAAILVLALFFGGKAWWSRRRQRLQETLQPPS